MSTTASYSPLNISETVRDRPRGLLPEDHQQDMASCHCRLMSLRSVEVSTTSCASYDGKLSGHCLRMRVKHWYSLQAFVSCRLDYCNSLFFGISVEPVAVGTERRRPSGDWYSTFIPHNAVAPSATLATGTPAPCDARSSVAVWHFTIAPSTQRPPSCRRCSRATTRLIRYTTCRTCVVSCDVDAFDDRGFAAAGPGLWNCLPSHAKEADLSQIPAVAKVIFVWIVGPRRNVNYFNCAVQNSPYLLTYLLKMQ